MKTWFWAFLAFCAILVAAPASAEIPELRGRVNDNANVLSPAQEKVLDARLASFETLPDKPQVFFLTTPTLDGKEIEEYSIKVARAWGVGQKAANNGILVTVYAPPGEAFKGRIEVGRRLEVALTDAASKAIYDMKMRPYFKKGQQDCFRALTGATDAFDIVLRKRTTDDPALSKAIAVAEAKERNDAFLFGGFMILLIFVAFGAILFHWFWWVGMLVGAVGGLLSFLIAGSLLISSSFGLVILVGIGAITVPVIYICFRLGINPFDLGGDLGGIDGVGGSGFSGGGGGDFGGGGFSGD